LEVKQDFISHIPTQVCRNLKFNEYLKGKFSLKKLKKIHTEGYRRCGQHN